MPVPIKPINLQQINKTENKNSDFLYLFSEKKVKISSADSEILLNVWMNTEKTNHENYKLNDCFENDISRLKQLGFVNGDKNNLRFTEKGKQIIQNICLNEINQFTKNKKNKQYIKILSSINNSLKIN